MRLLVLILLTQLVFLGCAPRAALGPVFLYPKVEPIQIELRDFLFQPNHIAILKDEFPFTFRLKTTAQIKHNFTLIDPHKNILISVDVMLNKSTTVTIDSVNSGDYTFYCNRFLHRFLGMEGMLMVRE